MINVCLDVVISHHFLSQTAVFHRLFAKLHTCIKFWMAALRLSNWDDQKVAAAVNRGGRLKGFFLQSPTNDNFGTSINYTGRLIRGGRLIVDCVYCIFQTVLKILCFSVFHVCLDLCQFYIIFILTRLPSSTLAGFLTHLDNPGHLNVSKLCVVWPL